MIKKRYSIYDYTQNSSRKISNSIELVEIIDELIEGDRKIYPLISIIYRKLKSVYYNL